MISVSLYKKLLPFSENAYWVLMLEITVARSLSTLFDPIIKEIQGNTILGMVLFAQMAYYGTALGSLRLLS